MEYCKYCGNDNFYKASKGPHIGLYCGKCTKLQKWVKQEHPIETGEPASEAQHKYALTLLEKWRQKGIGLTARQAGAIIQAFKE
jgi:hypothetical protein